MAYSKDLNITTQQTKMCAESTIALDKQSDCGQPNKGQEFAMSQPNPTKQRIKRCGKSLSGGTVAKLLKSDNGPVSMPTGDSNTSTLTQKQKASKVSK